VPADAAQGSRIGGRFQVGSDQTSSPSSLAGQADDWMVNPKAETAWGVEYEGRGEQRRIPQRTNPFSKHQSTRKDEVNEDGKQRVIMKRIDSESLKELATPMSCTKGCR